MGKKYKEYNDAAAFDILNEYVYIIDIENFDMLFMNKMAQERFHTTLDEIRGKKCYEILRGFDAPCSFCGALGMTMDNVCHWMSHNKVLNEYHQVQDTPIIYKGRKARVEMSIDVTAQVLQRQKLKAALDTETAMLEAIRILNDSMDISKAIDKMLNYLGMCFDAKRTYIYELQEENFVNTYEWNRYDSDLSFGKGHSLPADEIRDRLQISESDVKLRTERKPLLENCGIDHSLLAPLKIEGKLAGFIGMDDPIFEEIDTLSVMMTTLAYFTSLSMVGANNRHSLELLSYTDAMTRVANRNAFIRDVRQFKENFAILPKAVGVIYLDLNELKKVNDRDGHEAGDRLIVALADAISFFFRRSEIYRVGGDEFVVIAVGIGEDTFEERISEIKRFIGKKTGLSVSVGSSWSADGTELDNLIDSADEIMYSKKQNYYSNRAEKKQN